MRFKDKVCIVTGGSSGIGKATSLQFAREGAKVAILSRTEAEGKETVAEIEKAGGSRSFRNKSFTRWSILFFSHFNNRGTTAIFSATV